MKKIFVDPFTRVNANMPNLGLAYAATIARAPVIDQHILPYPRDRFVRHQADEVLLSVKSFTRGEALRIRSRYLAQYPGARVRTVTGILDIQCCYPYVAGEDNLVMEEPFSDRLPFPDYSLFDSYNYLSTNWQTGFWSYPLMTSSGCPYQCSFCAARNRQWRSRSAHNCFEELLQAKEKHGIVSFEVIDDAFNVDKKRVIEFCGLIAPLGLAWACTNGIRADRFDEDVARAMRDAGCRHVGFGIESTDPSILEGIGKGESFETIRQAAGIARKYFPKVSGFFILGLPGATYEKDLASLNWAAETGIRAHFSYFVPVTRAEGSDAAFYGSASGSCSAEYSRELQKKIYDMSVQMRRKNYADDRLVRGVLGYTLKGLPKYSASSLMTHGINLAKRGFSFFTRGEIA